MRRITLAASLLFLPALSLAQTGTDPGSQAGTRPSALPDAPSFLSFHSADPEPIQPQESSSLASPDAQPWSLYPAGYEPSQQDQTAAQQDQTAAQQARQSDGKPGKPVEVDSNGNPIPLSRQQPKRILGFMPNFRSVSAGAIVPRPGWKYNFKISTRQAFDYSSFLFLGLTTATAYATDSHPSLDTNNGGNFPFYGYLWRGFLDKTDGTYLGAWLLPSLLHQDNRYYPLGDGHTIITRVGYIMSRQVVTRTYHGHQTFNLSGLGGKVLTQYISRFYYPPNSSGFSVLATKFAYASMRDMGFSAIREFYPDIAAHYVRLHREKQARVASAADVRAAGVPATN